MSNYILGIDGGGTKTLGVLWDLDGKEVLRVEKGFANFNVDSNASKANIESVIAESIKDIKGNISVYMGVSGISGLKDKETYLKELKAKFNLAHVSMESDGYLSLHSVKNDHNLDVIMVIGGTGSIAYSLNDSSVTRLGGYGHILGDEGSAYYLVIQAFKYLIKDFEENEKLSSFSEDLMKLLKVKSTEELKGLVYNVSKDKVAGLAIHISTLAEKGIQPAIDLLEEQGLSLARLVINAYNRLGSDKQVIVAIRGGFINKAPFVKDAFIKELNNNNVNCLIDSSNNEPVLGAISIYKNTHNGNIRKYK